MLFSKDFKSYKKGHSIFPEEINRLKLWIYEEFAFGNGR
jgi:hypothetical protein